MTLDLGGVCCAATPHGTDLDRERGLGRRPARLRGRDAARRDVRRLPRLCRRRELGRVILEDMTFDGWYGQELRSTLAAEDPSDWLRPHENDADEWISKYGAAISFTDCEDVTVRRCLRTPRPERHPHDAHDRRRGLRQRLLVHVGLGASGCTARRTTSFQPQHLRLLRSRLQPRRVLARAGLGRASSCSSAAATTSFALQQRDTQRRRGLPVRRAGHRPRKRALVARRAATSGGAIDNLFYKNDLRYSQSPTAFEGYVLEPQPRRRATGPLRVLPARCLGRLLERDADRAEEQDRRHGRTARSRSSTDRTA